jgi:23S rRNA (cytosine1962-C5)-methyltransferase
MLKIILKKNEERRVREGHPWIFSNEIRDISGEAAPGAAAEVFDAGGGYLGTGYYNQHSLIAVRILSRRREDIDSQGFFVERIARALRLRKELYPGAETFRVVYGESDFLPGLVADKYGDRLSVQILTAGIESRREQVIAALREVLDPRGIVARNDVAVRSLEGLERKVEVLFGDVPSRIEVEEHGLRFVVDAAGGQKTGHFLDQKENHLRLKEICGGKEVLDCFSYSGSWGIHAAAYGAASVTCVDVSEKALELARENATLNGLLPVMTFDAADAFERLRELTSERRKFDVVVLDPPAFVKSRKSLKEGLKGYLTVNRRGIELLREGGYLVTCTCSHHVDREAFRDVLLRASRQAGREMRVVATGSQSLDHPILLGVPETEYLKCLVLQAV